MRIHFLHSKGVYGVKDQFSWSPFLVFHDWNEWYLKLLVAYTKAKAVGALH
jgi:hypothetical protein